MKKFVRSIFIRRPFEDVLVFLLGLFPNSFLQSLASQNYEYPLRSIRHCTRKGIKYELDISDYQNWLIYFHSNSDSSFGVLQYVHVGNVVFDVGANIGQTAMAVAKKIGPNGMVYAFEPFPETCKKFEANLAKNSDISSNIHIQNVGLAATESYLTMYKDCETNSGANRMTPIFGAEEKLTTKVPVITLDAFVKDKNIQQLNVIKIDVEGFEMQVLLGATKTLNNFKPDLFIELDDSNLQKQGNSANELCMFLKEYGYKIYEEGNSTELEGNHLHKQINIFCSAKKM